MKVYDYQTDNCLGQQRQLSDLSSFNIGSFLIDARGHVVQFDKTAGRLLGINEETVFEDLHISRLDRFLHTGTWELFERLLSGETENIQQHIECTNYLGRYMVINVCCRSAWPGSDIEPAVYGMIQEVGSRLPDSDGEHMQHRELLILDEVAAALSSSLELDRILRVILTGATADQGLGFNRAFLMLYDQPTGRLTGHMAVGPASAEEAGDIWKNLEVMRLPLKELLEGEPAYSDPGPDGVTPLVADFSVDLGAESQIADAFTAGSWINLQNSPELDPVSQQMADRFGTTRMALVPLVSKGNLLGLLVADNKITGRPICDQAVKLLQILANQAAVAMERAKLHQLQKERTRQLEQANQLLAQSHDQIVKIEKMSVIGKLTSAVAHELRNPLTIIGGFANLMLKQNITGEQREYLSIIAGETKRTEDVLHEVLDFSRASRGSRTRLDFSDLIETNLRLLGDRRGSCQVDTSFSRGPDELPIYVNGDQISHAVYQFLRLATEELQVHARADIRTERKPDRAVLRIRITCNDENRSRLARRLKQLFSAGRASVGLTLLVAGETIRCHGGDFGLAVGEDYVAEIYIELPLSEVDDV